jgi:hypothetical protein
MAPSEKKKSHDADSPTQPRRNLRGGFMQNTFDVRLIETAGCCRIGEVSCVELDLCSDVISH